MGEPFNAIGFHVPDEPAYQALAEQAHQQGVSTKLQRAETTLHGYCWQLGDGLELWAMLHQSGEGTFFVDCRPAFRARHLFRLHPWEISEYERDGEALVTGTADDTGQELIFELQNMTEMPPENLKDNLLMAAIGGLAYRVRVLSQPDTATGKGKAAAPPEHAFALTRSVSPRRRAADSDYSVTGQVLEFKRMRNEHTQTDLFWIHADFQKVRLELIVNAASVRGELRRGAWISAELWLQGHVLSQKELQSRYEGIDAEFSPGDYWLALRREN
ncbi:MAG: DUF3881 family protein [Blastocatellia bacterium]